MPTTMRRGRSPSPSSPFRALAHHQQAYSSVTPTDSVSLIRSFNVETNPTRPMRPSPLTASTIRDMPLDLVDRIRSFPLFLSAPEEFLVAIGNHLKPQIHGANDHIIREGDDAKAMYWLVRGVVAVTSRDGEAVYAELKPGAFFGEIGVLMKMPRTATIVARTKCLLLVLRKEDLHRVMPMFPEMEKAIMQEAQERLTLLKKKRQEGNVTLKSVNGDINAREAAPGQVATGESGVIKDGAVVNTKKRKSPSPGIIEDPSAGSAIGSGFVNIRQTLKELPLFSTMPPDILHFLGLSAQPKTYPPFSDIVQQGSTGNEIFFIVRGEAEVIHDEAKPAQPAPDVPRLIARRPRLRQGQYFGEVASLGLSPGRTATVRSITTVECLMIPGNALDELWRRCPADIKSQVEETARKRYHHPADDVEMHDADMRLKAKSDPPTPTTPVRTPTALPHVTFTTPSKPASPSKDDSEIMEPTDPDPFLSVDMENLRNRRRHSLAPPTPMTETPAAKVNGIRSHLVDVTPIKFEVPFTQRPAAEPEVRTKRAKILPHRPHPPLKVRLSDEILVKIFRYLDVGQLLLQRRVSTHWRKLVTVSPELCHDVDLSSYNRTVTDQVITQVLAPFIGTRALRVNLNNCFHVTDEGFSTLWRQCGRNVKSWCMRSVWDVSANQILEMSENAKSLEEVDWSNCRKVGDNLLGRVVGWVVPETLPSNNKVIISSSAHKTRSKASSHHQQHQQQRPSNMPAPDAGFQSWAQFRFEKLTYLCLADCTYLSDNAVVALVNAAKKLTHLDLSFCCALSDTATEVVALGLPRLRELRLAFCGSAVSDGSLESVALHLNELEGLSVRGCVRVTGKGVESILAGCGRLKWLDVSQCRNLEGWLRAGGVAKWGYDDRSGGPTGSDSPWASKLDEESKDDLPLPRTMSVSMLTTPSYLPRSTGGTMGKGKLRRPVRFITEKAFQGLR
ncbi:hypothetical protein S7711_01175 [Stachybotrys chartarum IBT 7711]|uniref:Cyclic nucleotide-binding domain-containing protein n=1 Tax=Stachybotrys chartarum (strain CBS 109288 / IBT 7711) TaxID=1280523 RepID=A0A084ASX0_STACB|nr:hypothetical protein S7711_01175 [Stachybotrys chartarum IBT 7711]KFA48956.1 hypothetical protein S40293_02514 [Stachybotrys chartarum IBT 40293]